MTTGASFTSRSSSEEPSISTSASHQRRSRHKQASLYRRHKLKLLNLALIGYLCLGAFLFDLLGDFCEEPPDLSAARLKVGGGGGKRSDNSFNSERQQQTIGSLSELRLNSVRRMWNITNQLNILYESNWTRLILDELVEFERTFIESFVAVGQEQQEEEEANEDSSPSPRQQQQQKQSQFELEQRQQLAKSKARSRSMRMSLIHSLATITTIDDNQPQKSVRFVNQNYHQHQQALLGDSEQEKLASKSAVNVELENDDDIEEESRRSFDLLLTSLLLLLLYLSLGVYLYSRDQKVTPAEAIYACYSLLTTSNLPECLSPNLESSNHQPLQPVLMNPLKLYETFAKEPTKSLTQTNQLTTRGNIKQRTSLEDLSIEALASYLFYLFCGLNLISMCSNFAFLWLRANATTRNESILSDSDHSEAPATRSSLPNGHIPPLTSTSLALLGAQQSGGLLVEHAHHQQPHLGEDEGEIDVLSAGPAEIQTITGNGGADIGAIGQRYGSQVGGTLNRTHHHHQHQQQQQVNLAELFVVSQQPSAAPAANELQFDLQHKQQLLLLQQQTSDASFASTDRSTERGSLCLRHSIQAPNSKLNSSLSSHAQSANNMVPYGSPPSTYSRQQQHAQFGQQQLAANQHQHRHHLSQSHLYLPTLFGQQDNGDQVGLVGDGILLRGEVRCEGKDERDDVESEEEQAMDRMLKSCLAASGKQQQEQQGQNYSPTIVDVNVNNPGNSFADSRLTMVGLNSLHRDQQQQHLQSNHCEQDSLNTTTLDTITTTNSNTMSSISSRTVKLPKAATNNKHHQQHSRLVPNGIGDSFLPNRGQQ